MAQAGRPKPPLDVLQGMINAILIETGKAFRPSNKESGRTAANVNARLRTIIPSAADNFHTALDELECDIIRAKSVLKRDLNELRAKRMALENPAPILVDAIEEEAVETNTLHGNAVLGDELLTSPHATSKEERMTKSPEKQMVDEPRPSVPEPATGIATQPPEDVEVLAQGPTPPATSNDASLDSTSIGLSTHTEGAPAPEGGLQGSAVDSLFDVGDGGNGDSALNFEGMDFSLDAAAQNPDTSQPQNNELDLSNSGNPNPSQTNKNTNADDQNKLRDDLFAMAQGMGGGDAMDLDMDMGMAGADDSAFDDLFYGAGDEGMGGGGEIQHGEFDNAFFGIE